MRCEQCDAPATHACMDDNYYDPDCAVPDVFAWYCAEHAHPLDVEIERHADDAQ